ncbi:MAG: phosphate ABC transporter permease PstA [Acidimicrobiia bacterium]|nr:phosphate ABC transporter permease PstA [Acidimicrobiia bacterium]
MSTSSTLNPRRATSEEVAKTIKRGGANWKPIAFQALLLILLSVSLLILIVLLADILVSAWPTFRDRGLSFITDGLSLNPETAGVWTAIVGSVIIAVVVAVLAFPVGIGAAIYLEEYAPNNSITRFVDTTVRNLAGVPSIVYGLLGLALFVPLVNIIGFGGATSGKNVVAAGITMAALVLPIVIITSAEAIRAVPNAIREAGYGVGATKWEVVKNHVMPVALPGVLTGTVLTLARAFGETAPLLVIGVATGFFAPAGDASFYDTLTGPYTALPVVVFSWTRQTQAEFAETLAPAAIVVLLVVLFILNGLAIWMRNRSDRKW